MNASVTAILTAFAALSLDAYISDGSVSAFLVHNGRGYNIIANSSRTILHACSTTPGAPDGYEVARFYGAPDVTIARAVARLAV